MNATTGTNVILCVDEPKANMLELMRAIHRAEAKVFDAIAIPPDMLRLLEEPRPSSADLINERIRGALPTLYGMQVHVSRLLDNMPVRVHRKRRNQSWAYHRRIQKKWNKRFGVGPVAVLMNTEALRTERSRNKS